MTRDQFTVASIAILRSAVGWQSAIARRLDVQSRQVRRWLAAGKTPPWVDERLAHLMGARETSPWPRDEWMIGHGVTADGRRREYIVHLAPPRFVARIVDLDDAGHPSPDEMPADVLTGAVYSAAPDKLICEIDWIDEVTPGQITQLLEAATAGWEMSK